MTNSTFNTNTSNMTERLNTLPIGSLQVEVACVGTDYDDNYSDRFVSEETRRKLEDAYFETDGEDEEIAEAKQKVLAQVDSDCESFFDQLDAERDDDFNGIASGTTESATGIQRFAAANAGMTLSQLLNGCNYAGGRIYADIDGMLDAAWDDETLHYEEGDTEKIEANASRYILQANGTFLLTA